MGLGARGDLVDLVEEDDAVLLDVLQRCGLDFLVIDQARGLLVSQRLHRFGDFHLAHALLAAADVLEHALDLLRQVFHAGRSEDFHAGLGCGDLDLDFLVVEFPLAQLLAKLLPRAGILARRVASANSCGRQQHVQHAILGRVHGAIADDAHRLFARVLDRGLGQVADDGVDVAADIADLGELGCLDLDEGRVGQARQAPRDLGLADAGGADHQDVLRRDLGAQGLGDLHAAPAVTQRDGHGALGARLADDVLVEFGDDLRGSHLGHVRAKHPMWAPAANERSEPIRRLPREGGGGGVSRSIASRRRSRQAVQSLPWADGRGRAFLPRLKFSIIRELQSGGSGWCRCTGRRRFPATS